MAVDLFDSESGRLVGSLSDDQFQELVDAFEEESPVDHDYYISGETVDMLEEDGASPVVVRLLRAALGEREGAEIRWEKH